MKAQELTALVQFVEHKFDKRLKTPSHFEAFSDEMGIQKLAASTLKRIWGYNRDYKEVSLSSVDMLAQYVGFKDYDDFVAMSTLKSDDQKSLYAASQIAKLCEQLHSERLEKAHKLVIKYRFHEALELFADDTVNDEIKILSRDLFPFIDNTRTLGYEMLVKSYIVWGCNWKEEDAISHIEYIYKQALPLAVAINDHDLLWNIYQDWAFKLNQLGDIEKSNQLYEKAFKQGQILQLENPDEYPGELVSTVNDLAKLLCDQELYQQAADKLETMFKYSEQTVFDGYIYLNYARACCCLDKIELSVEYFEKAIDLALVIINEYPTSHEVNHLLAMANYNLGTIYEGSDDDIAKKYYKTALDAFASQNIPNILHDHYYMQCKERIEQLP